MGTTTAANITDEQIEALLDEATEAGDARQAATCTLALEGDEVAVALCAAAIRCAEAMDE